MERELQSQAFLKVSHYVYPTVAAKGKLKSGIIASAGADALLLYVHSYIHFIHWLIFVFIIIILFVLFSIYFYLFSPLFAQLFSIFGHKVTACRKFFDSSLDK